MKNQFIKIASLLLFGIALSSCNEDDAIIFDAENGRAIASFVATDGQSSRITPIIINPTEVATTTIVIGVSTVSTSDRTVDVELASTSTLDPSFYTIEGIDNLVIPAGSFTASFQVVTDVPEGSGLPPSTAQLTFDLMSVEGAEILGTGASLPTQQYPIDFQCNSVDLPNVRGTVAVTQLNSLASGAFGLSNQFADPRTLVPGPGDNEVTLIGGIAINGSSDIILAIDPVTGNITGRAVEPTDALPLGNSFTNGGRVTATTGITGRALTCINQIDITLTNSRFGAPFNANRLVLIVQ